MGFALLYPSYDQIPGLTLRTHFLPFQLQKRKLHTLLQACIKHSLSGATRRYKSRLHSHNRP
jgi:hypothetical protein